jgi:hypothetical protein
MIFFKCQLTFWGIFIGWGASDIFNRIELSFRPDGFLSNCYKLSSPGVFWISVTVVITASILKECTVNISGRESYQNMFNPDVSTT